MYYYQDVKDALDRELAKHGGPQEGCPPSDIWLILMGLKELLRINDELEFPVHSYVHKKKGYKYPGMVMAAFRTRKDEMRYAVEAFNPDFDGMLHIFSGNQLVNTNKELMEKILKDSDNEDDKEV